MKFTPIILALSLLLTACNRRDAKLGHQLLGTWTGEAEAATMTFAPDGGFLIVKKSDTNIYAGTWQIRDGVLVMKITKSPSLHGHSQAGPETRCKIVSMDSHQFVYTVDGSTFTLSR